MLFCCIGDRFSYRGHKGISRLKNIAKIREKQIHVYFFFPSDLLDHDGDILVQVAAVELHQIHENMQEVGGEAYVHPQEDKACWDSEMEKKKKNSK